MGFSNFFYEHFIKTAIDYDTWDRQLTNKGWEKKGEGSFGVAYVHPNKDYIYKVFRDDQGYDFFLKFALENQKDRTVVKLKRVVLDNAASPDEMYLSNKSIPNVIVLEKLVSLQEKFSNYDVIFNASHAILNTLEIVYKKGMTFEEAIAALLLYSRQQYAKEQTQVSSRSDYGIQRWRRMIHVLSSPFIYKMPIFRTIYKLFLFRRKYNGGFSWDLHDGNLMYRESTGDIVLTDPFV